MEISALDEHDAVPGTFTRQSPGLVELNTSAQHQNGKHKNAGRSLDEDRPVPLPDYLPGPRVSEDFGLLQRELLHFLDMGLAEHKAAGGRPFTQQQLTSQRRLSGTKTRTSVRSPLGSSTSKPEPYIESSPPDLQEKLVSNSLEATSRDVHMTTRGKARRASASCKSKVDTPSALSKRKRCQSSVSKPSARLLTPTRPPSQPRGNVSPLDIAASSIPIRRASTASVESGCKPTSKKRRVEPSIKKAESTPVEKPRGQKKETVSATGSAAISPSEPHPQSPSRANHGQQTPSRSQPFPRRASHGGSKTPTFPVFRNPFIRNRSAALPPAPPPSPALTATTPRLQLGVSSGLNAFSTGPLPAGAFASAALSSGCLTGPPLLGSATSSFPRPLGKHSRVDGLKLGQSPAPAQPVSSISRLEQTALRVSTVREGNTTISQPVSAPAADSLTRVMPAPVALPPNVTYQAARPSTAISTTVPLTTVSAAFGLSATFSGTPTLRELAVGTTGVTAVSSADTVTTIPEGLTIPIDPPLSPLAITEADYDYYGSTVCRGLAVTWREERIAAFRREIIMSLHEAVREQDAAVRAEETADSLEGCGWWWQSG